MSLHTVQASVIYGVIKFQCVVIDFKATEW